MKELMKKLDEVREQNKAEALRLGPWIEESSAILAHIAKRVAACLPPELIYKISWETRPSGLTVLYLHFAGPGGGRIRLSPAHDGDGIHVRHGILGRCTFMPKRKKLPTDALIEKALLKVLGDSEGTNE